jgi:hypothetical protein
MPDPNYEEPRLKIGLGAGIQRGIFGGAEWQIPLTDSRATRLPFIFNIGIDPGTWSAVFSAGIGFYSKPDDYFRKWGWGVVALASHKTWTDGPESIRGMFLSFSPTFLIRRWSKTWLLSIGPVLESRTRRISTDHTEETRKQTLLGATAEICMLFW